MSRRAKRKNRFEEGDDLNPMNYLSNLSDAMLVLAVGIMVSLILHWNVQINTPDTASDSQGGQNTVSFTDDELTDQEEVPEDMQRMGDVYYDANTGTYYIIEDSGEE